MHGLVDRRYNSSPSNLFTIVQLAQHFTNTVHYFYEKNMWKRRAIVRCCRQLNVIILFK